ncbi:MAG: HD domain-containing protein [Alicyclobacillus sp.]|nr:HD domain-containing protein [Alicyclobacillus sp.]
MKGTEVRLLAFGDGTEVIHHHLKAGTAWGLYPAEGWHALEAVYVLSGKLRIFGEEDGTLFEPGDCIHACPVTRQTVFVAEEDSSFLYVSSAPVFHEYTGQIQHLKRLAASIEEKDGYTAGHCERIHDLAMQIGQALHLGQTDAMYLNYASFLHDVGKLCVPLEILNKPGLLTDEEWRVMKQHTVYGRRMLEETGLPLLLGAAPLVHYHHERFDGTGYFGLKGEEIPFGARIIAVVDAFDAMTTDRPYQRARSKREALREITTLAGTWYDPDVVEVFHQLARILPEG